MEQLLRRLLEDLENIERDHGEVGDTEVREAMRGAIHHGFINPKPDFVLGHHFAMYSSEADAKVEAALWRFLEQAEEKAKAEGLDTPKARLDAFQNLQVRSPGGHFYDDFFGYASQPW
jgi:hypothetical protein